MKRKTIILFLICSVIYAYPSKTYSQTQYNVYTLDEEYPNTETIHSFPCYIPDDYPNEKKAEILIKNLLNNDQNVVKYIPKGTELLGVTIHNDELIINLNENVRNYGGSFYENKLVKQILYTSFELKEINYVTLHIEGKLDYLPQGSLINKINRNDLRRYFTNEGDYFCD